MDTKQTEERPWAWETRDISILIQHLLAFSHHPNNAPSLQTIQLHFQQQQQQHHHLTHQKPSNANMQFTILAFAAMAAAIPAMIQERAPGSVCPALDTPLCCQADVDGVVDLTCEARKYPPLYLLLQLTQTLMFFSFRQLPTPPPSTPSRAAVPRAALQPSAALCLWYVPALTAKPFYQTEYPCTDNNNPRRLVRLFSAAPHKYTLCMGQGGNIKPTNPFFS